MGNVKNKFVYYLHKISQEVKDLREENIKVKAMAVGQVKDYQTYF